MEYILVLLRNRKAMVGVVTILLFAIIAIFAPLIAPYPPTYMGFDQVLPPSAKHLFGTTATGQDVFSQIVWGTRLTLLVGLLSGLFVTVISTVIGVVAGYLGGIVDEILMILTNVFLIIPGLPLMIILSTYMPVKGMWTIILVITVTGWAWGARMIRPQVMSLKSRDFVKASVVIGESPFHIIAADILPNVVGLIVAQFFAAAVYGVLSEAGLEFLGLGNASAISWGTVLYWADNGQAILFGLWTWLLVPGLLIALFGGALAMMNFAVDEMVNPRLKKR
ncbi:MAG TPA: ABC transporter permease [Spirochaetia bacterium]|nr:ABC transporter permease [Spirochaetia bacterium]